MELSSEFRVDMWRKIGLEGGCTSVTLAVIGYPIVSSSKLDTFIILSEVVVVVDEDKDD